MGRNSEWFVFKSQILGGLLLGVIFDTKNTKGLHNMYYVKETCCIHTISDSSPGQVPNRIVKWLVFNEEQTCSLIRK